MNTISSSGQRLRFILAEIDQQSGELGHLHARLIGEAFLDHLHPIFDGEEPVLLLRRRYGHSDYQLVGKPEAATRDVFVSQGQRVERTRVNDDPRFGHVHSSSRSPAVMKVTTVSP
jgi:hypothetical protein